MLVAPYRHVRDLAHDLLPSINLPVTVTTATVPQVLRRKMETTSDESVTGGIPRNMKTIMRKRWIIENQNHHAHENTQSSQPQNGHHIETTATATMTKRKTKTQAGVAIAPIAPTVTGTETQKKKQKTAAGAAASARARVHHSGNETSRSTVQAAPTAPRHTSHLISTTKTRSSSHRHCHPESVEQHGTMTKRTLKTQAAVSTAIDIIERGPNMSMKTPQTTVG